MQEFALFVGMYAALLGETYALPLQHHRQPVTLDPEPLRNLPSSEPINETNTIILTQQDLPIVPIRLGSLIYGTTISNQKLGSELVV